MQPPFSLNLVRMDELCVPCRPRLAECQPRGLHWPARKPFHGHGESMASRVRFFLLPLLALTLAAACSKDRAQNDSVGSSASPTGKHPTIVFMTDFGTANDAVTICKAVIIGIAPDVRIIDMTHQVTPYQIEEASRFLADVTAYYPPGTVFLVVVDPGVGTSRKAVIVKSRRGQFFVLPDNGLVTPVIERDGLATAREITNQAVAVEHGRDQAV